MKYNGILTELKAMIKEIGLLKTFLFFAGLGIAFRLPDLIILFLG